MPAQSKWSNLGGLGAISATDRERDAEAEG